MNSGYVGYSRSVRSQSAIENYEMPISLIKKDVIQSFLIDNKDEFNHVELQFLENLTITKWKFITREYTSPSSWHHTSGYFNQTDHYDLLHTAKKIIKLQNDIDQLYKASKEKNVSYKFGVMKVQVWAGSRKRPKLIGEEIVAGIIIGSWLYYKNEHNKCLSTNKFKIVANKVIRLDEYQSYEELIQSHKEYKHTKRVFNALIKEKVLSTSK